MNKLFSAGIVALGLVAAAPSQAAITYYNSAAAFDAALSSVSVEDFNDNTLVSGLSFTSTVGNIASGAASMINWRLVRKPPLSISRPPSTAWGANFDLTPGGAGVGILWTIHLFSGG